MGSLVDCERGDTSFTASYTKVGEIRQTPQSSRSDSGTALPPCDRSNAYSRSKLCTRTTRCETLRDGEDNPIDFSNYQPLRPCLHPSSTRLRLFFRIPIRHTCDLEIDRGLAHVGVLRLFRPNPRALCPVYSERPICLCQGRTLYWTIMSWSSCSALWQWKIYRPVKSVNFIATWTSSPF